MDTRGLRAEEKRGGTDPPREAKARPVLKDLRERVERGINDEDVARKARGDSGRHRDEQRPDRPGAVGEPAPPALEDGDRGEEEEIRVVQDEGRMIERLAVDETGERELDEVPASGQGRRAPMPRLLDAEEKPRFSREKARSEDPEEHAGNGRQTGEEAAPQRAPVGFRRYLSGARRGERFDRERQGEGERRQSGRSREQAEQGRRASRNAASARRRKSDSEYIASR